MLELVRGVLTIVFAFRARLAAENLVLRHQLGVVGRSVKRPRLRKRDRIFWVWLSKLWPDWRAALVVVKPATVIAWHRKGFRLYWTWKSRRNGKGRPAVASEIRELIGKMSRANPCWGAPRVHGELLKLGIGISQSRTVHVLGQQDSWEE